MSIQERLKRDYFGPNRYAQYREVLQKALQNGYRFVTLKEFDVTKTKQVILRHDIDSDIGIAKKMFAIEKSLGIRSTYYFRKNTANKRLMRTLTEYGCEVSYHFEEIAQFAYRHNLSDREEIFSHIGPIRENFKKNLEKFRKKGGCESKTVASHGDFVNRKTGIVNNELLNDALRKECGILREAYDAELMDNTKYCSDCRDDFLSRCDFEEADNYYLLLHPRNWAPNLFTRSCLDLQRAFRGVKYKFGSKLHNIWKIVRQIRTLPKAKLSFYGADQRETYRYFTKPHPKYKIFKNKAVGACLLKKPQSFEEYLAGKEKQNLRTARNKSIKNGYTFREISVKDHVDGILEINLSKNERQGHEMTRDYFDKEKIVSQAEGKQCFGVFDKEGQILAYCYLIEAGDFIIISRLLGHADYLKEGVMFFMIGECVKLWLETDRWKDVEYFFYDTWFGALKGLKKFKQDLGFVPCKVKYTFSKEKR